MTLTIKEPLFIQQRNKAYSVFKGNGLEVGAFEHLARLPEDCKTMYCDVISEKSAKELFPEIDVKTLKKVDFLVDIDQDGLKPFKSNSQDYLIINHVIEHLFDPIEAINECFRVIKHGGLVAISVPDKRYTYDSKRPLTSFDEIHKRILRQPKSPIPDDYIDILNHIHPEILERPVAEQKQVLVNFLLRREHLSVWTAESFVSFLQKVLVMKKIKTKKICEFFPDTNKFEYFCIMQKLA